MDKPKTIDTYHKNTSLRTTVPVIENKRNGRFKRYDDKGNLVEETDYKNDKIHGYQKIYDNQKRLCISISYYQGLKHGETVQYINGLIKDYYLYVSGKLHHKWLSSL
jgi:antitoxin component YwqK of YwqJK toxin-antitoxin module